MVTRRGTNAFHGGAYDFVRNRAFQAGQFFRPSSGAPRFSYNQFGADGGGPIRKDKTFFFVHYEGRRRRTGVILQGLVPTLDMQAGNFTGTGVNIKDPLNNNQSFPGNSIPASRFDPVAAKLLQYFPAPNFINQRPGINYLVAPSDWERRDQTTGRIDHRLSDKGSLFGRYSLADDALANVDYRPGVGLIRPDRTQYVVAGYTHLFSPTLISETRLGFLKCFTARYNDGDTTSTNLSQQAGLKNLSAVPGEYSNPTIRLTGYSPGSPTDGSTPSFVGYAFGSTQVQNNEYYRMAETITNVRGKHNLKIGGDFSRLLVGYEQGGSQNGVLSFSGNFTGNAFGDYLLGFPLSASGGLGDVGNVGRVAKYTFSSQFQAFVQDDWRITDKLVLNLGLRYEFFLPVRGRLANFDLATGRQLIAGSADYFVPGVGLVKGTGPALLPERPQSADWNNFASAWDCLSPWGEDQHSGGRGCFLRFERRADYIRYHGLDCAFLRDREFDLEFDRPAACHVYSVPLGDSDPRVGKPEPRLRRAHGVHLSIQPEPPAPSPPGPAGRIGIHREYGTKATGIGAGEPAKITFRPGESESGHDPNAIPGAGCHLQPGVQLSMVRL